MPFVVIIPARYGSSRFPGKPLVDINGKPMVRHVIDRAFEAGAERVILATDSQDIATAAASQCEVCMTRDDHNSGTERLAEVVESLGLADDTVIVNVQGDEPFVPATNIRQVATNLEQNSQVEMATLSTPFMDEAEISNPNMVKVVVNKNGEALYFSRSAIPYDRAAMLENSQPLNPAEYFRHIGLYAYSARYIKKYVSYAPSALEQTESLEQLRALWYGDKIHVDVASAPPPVGIDTPEDLKALLNTLATN
ncbi:3-deoxy-manno-octulosonate cytidylyltransferase [Salinimonas iocasae]|uniref:3-deoxy-manno-octulosonate cytidylyltransferase n=1 Tax=Salinimonas iocasae TaxID=2572577 RepID=A0A5B7YEC4_9ALTE|nr:3-deoxy-manno-octulosonate cytidylyltransferase [Salinimonas iocasae]QCZ93596.1 3-deoxy-manno-octulosonate cytidylyltransferase [Salinimonas iocasae]